MNLLNIKKPTKLNPKWTAIFSHQGKQNICEFDDYKSALSFYVKSKHECGELFIN